MSASRASEHGDLGGSGRLSTSLGLHLRRIPQRKIVVVATIGCIGVGSSRGSGCCTDRLHVLRSTVIVRWLSIAAGIVIIALSMSLALTTGSSTAAALLSSCVHLVHYRDLGLLDGVAATNELDLSIGLAGLSLRDVDLAAGAILHLTNGLATLADNHANCVRGDEDGVLGLVMAAGTARTAAAEGVATPSAACRIAPTVSAVAIHNLEDEFLRMASRLGWADEVDGSKAVDALVLADNVDMAAAALLQVTDGFAAASNDQAHGSIGDHDLERVFAFLCNGSRGRWSASVPAAVCGSLSPHVGRSTTSPHATVLDDAVDHIFCSLALSPGPCNLALPIFLVRVRCRDELDSAPAILLDAAEILALATNDEADETSFDGYRLSVAVILASQRGAVAAAALSSRRKATAARGEGALATVVTRRSVVASPLVTVGIDIIAVAAARWGALGARPWILAMVGLTGVSLLVAAGLSLVWGEALFRSEGLGLRDGIGDRERARVDRADSAQINGSA